MVKTRRKACDESVVSPMQLWERFNQKIEGMDPYELTDILGNKFSDDISKVNFDFENLEFDHLEEILGQAMGWLGMRKMWTAQPFTCFSYIGCQAGGDWEHPVNFMIYLDQDGKTFRGYVPKSGNVWNYDTKQAFGNDDEADRKFLKTWFEKNEPDSDFDFDEVINLMSDPSLMLHEIMYRFEGVK